MRNSHGLSPWKNFKAVKNIRLTPDPGEIEARVEKSTMVLKTMFLKKA
jgi:uncharacterized Zn ribbon protein